MTARERARIKYWQTRQPWKDQPATVPLNHLRITTSAYPEETENAISRFLSGLASESERVQQLLRFSLLCILESVSFTRKDGQFLRWDYRSKRNGADTYV